MNNLNYTRVSFKIRLTFFVCINFVITGTAQSYEYTYADKILTMTTIVKVYSKSIIGQASAFFYQSEGNLYLVSNRHVFYPNEDFPDSIIYNLRVFDTLTKRGSWFPVKLDQEYLRLNIKLHDNKLIDVASVVLNSNIYNPNKIKFVLPFAVKQPDIATINLENHEIGDDILIVGYPKGYYDSYNLIPIMKSGIIASFYQTNFNNLPYFLIDSKLFHGSSGSIVISKFKPLFLSKSEHMLATKKDFTFLGIFSGEPYILGPKIETDESVLTKKEKFDLGIVWYPWVLNELK